VKNKASWPMSSPKKKKSSQYWPYHGPWLLASTGCSGTPTSGLTEHVASRATAFASSVGGSLPPHGGCVSTPPTLCQCILPVWRSFLSVWLCAAPSVHITLPHGQYICGRRSHVLGVPGSYPAVHWRPTQTGLFHLRVPSVPACAGK